MERYINPVPVMLTDEDISYFYQPITDLLNVLSAKGLIQPSSSYFKLLVTVEKLPEVLNELKGIGIEFTLDIPVRLIGNAQEVEINFTESFSVFVGQVKGTFLMQLREGQGEPDYLRNKFRQAYCESCTRTSCTDITPYCTRLYMDYNKEERND